MYLVKTYLSLSPIEGIGVFAAEDISAGAPVWRFVEGFDLVLREEDVQALPMPAQEHLIKHAFWSLGKIYLCGDYGQFTNHSPNPNTGFSTDVIVETALRDIKKSEEITSDYRSFDERSHDKIGILTIASI